MGPHGPRCLLLLVRPASPLWHYVWAQERGRSAVQSQLGALSQYPRSLCWEVRTLTAKPMQAALPAHCETPPALPSQGIYTYTSCYSTP